MQYGISFFDHGGNIYSMDSFAADDDMAAIASARHLFRMSLGMGYEIRRDGAHVHTEIFQGAKKHVPAIEEYTVHLMDAEHRIVALERFVVDGDGDALAVAAILCEACGDRCQSYELWCGSRQVAIHQHPVPKLHQLRDYAQSVAIDREIALRNSRTLIAQSERLLANLKDAGVPGVSTTP